MQERDGVMARAESAQASAEPGVKISAQAARIAALQAEEAVRDTQTRLKDAELERDTLARRLGHAQDKVDRLYDEIEHRTSHARNLHIVLGS